MPSPVFSPLNPDFADLLRALSGADARYLIVGGYALGPHGVLRTTGDLDVWVEATLENAARVHAALAAFGAPLRDLSVQDLATPAIGFQMGVPPRRIDILTSVSGVEFGAAWPRRITVTVGGLSIPVIGREDLIANKRASGRPKDLLDVEALEKADLRR